MSSLMSLSFSIAGVFHEGMSVGLGDTRDGLPVSYSLPLFMPIIHPWFGKNPVHPEIHLIVFRQ
jgi:hypothetical protein